MIGIAESQAYGAGDSFSERSSDDEGVELPQDAMARKQRNRECFLAMRKLVPRVQNGESVRTILKPDGTRLSFEERRVLLRLVPNDRARTTGRQVHISKDNIITDAGYECEFNLAGRFFISTSDGLMTELTFKPTALDCGHTLCDAAPRVRVGGHTDGVVMVIKQKSADLPNGILSSTGIGTVADWNALYHSAVFLVVLAKANLTLAKYRALLGHKFIPKSKFGEVCVMMSRMMGIQEAAFFQYFEAKDVFDDVYDGTVGASARFQTFYASQHNRVERLSNYAWGLHHLCQMQALYPDVDIPLQWFLTDIDKLSRRSTTVLQRCMTHYESLGVRHKSFVEVHTSSTAVDLSVQMAQTLASKEIEVNRIADEVAVEPQNAVKRHQLQVAVDACSSMRLVSSLRYIEDPQIFSEGIKKFGVVPLPINMQSHLFRNSVRINGDNKYWKPYVPSNSETVDLNSLDELSFYKATGGTIRGPMRVNTSLLWVNSLIGKGVRRF